MRTLLIVVAVMALPLNRAHAAGFQVYEHGAAGTATAGAQTAVSHDPSAIFYNPAALPGPTELRVDVGATLVLGQPQAGTTDSEQQTIPLPAVFLAWGFDDRTTFGIGVFTQYGLQIDWPQSFSGRFLVDEAALKSATINPTIAYQALPWLAIGGGVDITPASVELSRRIDLIDVEGAARFTGNTVGWGVNAGVLVDGAALGLAWRPTFGMSYRSRYDLDFEDGALRVDAPLELSGVLHDTPASTKVPIPDVLSTGVGVRPRSDLTLTAQLDWVNWSRFQTLALDTPNAPEMSMAIPQDWHDGWTARLGAEVVLDDGDALRAGLGYDWNPVPSETLSPILPDSDRVLVALGGAFRVAEDFRAELGILGVFFRDRTSTNPALPINYQNLAILTTLTLSWERR